jgi:hypothetical protein
MAVHVGRTAAGAVAGRLGLVIRPWLAGLPKDKFDFANSIFEIELRFADLPRAALRSARSPGPSCRPPPTTMARGYPYRVLINDPQKYVGPKNLQWYQITRSYYTFANPHKSPQKGLLKEAVRCGLPNGLFSRTMSVRGGSRPTSAEQGGRF